MNVLTSVRVVLVIDFSTPRPPTISAEVSENGDYFDTNFSQAGTVNWEGNETARNEGLL